jgi:hypothetical protein
MPARSRRRESGASREVDRSAECCERRPCGLIGLPAATSTSRFPARPVAPPPASSPAILRARVHPLVSSASSSESSRIGPALRTDAARAFLGVSFPIATSAAEIHLRPGSQPRPTVRPRRFSRPRRVSPSTASRVCFTPQPRPGFTFQGFSPAAEPGRLVDGPCPPVVGPSAPAASRLVAPAPPTSPPGLRSGQRSAATGGAVNAVDARSPPRLPCSFGLSSGYLGVAFTPPPPTTLPPNPACEPGDRSSACRRYPA